MNNIDILEEYTKHDTDLVNMPEYDAKIICKAIKTLIAENKELKEDNEYLKNQIPIDKIFYYSYKDFIPKSKVEELIEELRNDTCKIINRTYIPTISSKLFNNNREKYEPMLEARNILINALNKLQSFLGKEE